MAHSALQSISQAFVENQHRSYGEARSMPGAFYADPQMLAFEKQHLFGSEWICVGRVEEIPQPGDFMTFDIVDEPVLLIRGEDHQVRALSNVCRHRGAIIAAGAGRVKNLICPYHHWAYDLTGRLRGAPHISERDDFDPKSCRLPQFQCEEWLGFLFVTLDPDAPALAPQLAGIEAMIKNYHMEEMKLRYLANEVWETNWKSLMENFMEGYHLSPLHRTTLHKVNPTNLCRHFPPGDKYFGYLAGFSPSLPRSENGHPDLTDEEVETCVMYAIPPGLAVGGAGDYSSFLCIQPEAVDRVRVKLGLIFFGETWQQPQVDRAVELFQDTMQEDKDVLVNLQRGQNSRFHEVGPLAPADFEGPIWDFYQYLGRMLGPTLSKLASANGS